MTAQPSSILVVNRGSSSLRFAVFSREDKLTRGLHGHIERIGPGGGQLSYIDPSDTPSVDGRERQAVLRAIDAPDHASAALALINWLESQTCWSSIVAVGHRVVHGWQHIHPEVVTQQLLDDLRCLNLYDPDHLPSEIALIEAFRARRPQWDQVACFDTAFHANMPRVAKLLPIPRIYYERGVQRYGFHGISYSYLMEELTRLDAQVAQARVILAHLGNGASMAAVLDGKSIDTSMGFTPTGGLPMGTRAGELDPGLALYLKRTDGMSTAQFYDMVNHQSGLLGVSGTSADMRDLLAAQKIDVRASEAVALFCYAVKKWIGSYAAALGGVDALVFSGGIGANAAKIRSQICEGLAFLGIEIDEVANDSHASLISDRSTRVQVRVIAADEERMIARSVSSVLFRERAIPERVLNQTATVVL